MRSTRSKNQKRKRGSKSRRRLRQRGGDIWGSLKKGVTTVAGHGANFADRFAAGVTSRVLAAVKSHKPFDRNVAIPVVRTKGVTYKFVNVSGNDYMWEIKGWNSNEPEKSFLVPTGWKLQMPYEGKEPSLLIPTSEWNIEYNLSEEDDPKLDGKDSVITKKNLANAMAVMYPIFKQEPIAKFDIYIKSEKFDMEDDTIRQYALRLPFSYWGTHLPVPQSMSKEQANKIRKQAEEAAKFFAITGNYLVRYRNKDDRLTFTYGGNKVLPNEIDDSWIVMAEVNEEDGSISFYEDLKTPKKS